MGSNLKETIMGLLCPVTEFSTYEPNLTEISGLVQYIDWVDKEMELAIEAGELARAGELASIQERLLTKLMAEC
jgi:hypothetical protein